LRSWNWNQRDIYLAAAASATIIFTVSIIVSDPLQDFLQGILAPLSGIVTAGASITTFVISGVNAGGYLGIFGLMLLEGTSLPIPSEVILPLGGYLVSMGRLEFWTTVALATSAGVIGALIDYYIGLYLGMRLISNYGSRFFISKDQMNRVEWLFARYGSWIIFGSRMMPGVRTLASFPAGSARMNLTKFVVYTALGCFLFDGARVYLGDYLGSNWATLTSIGIVEIGAMILVLLAAAWVFLKLHGRPRGDSR
jgi:membrane protein DedA with SNARE-associated domain